MSEPTDAIERLLPCPFCGGEAHWPEPEVNIPYVGCKDCGANAQDEVRWSARVNSHVAGGAVIEAAMKAFGETELAGPDYTRRAAQAIDFMAEQSAEIRRLRKALPDQRVMREALEKIAADMREAEARNVPWISESEAEEFAQRIDAVLATAPVEHGGEG